MVLPLAWPLLRVELHKYYNATNILFFLQTSNNHWEKILLARPGFETSVTPLGRTQAQKREGGIGQGPRRAGATQQTAGVWVVVNHPEMSLFPRLNEAQTTKGKHSLQPDSQSERHMTASFRGLESRQKLRNQSDVPLPPTMPPNLLRIGAPNEGPGIQQRSKPQAWH